MKRKAPAGTGARDKRLNQPQNNPTGHSQARASKFGIGEHALSEIEDTVREYLRERALRLAGEGFWKDRERELFEAHGEDRVPQSLRADDFAREFGQALHPVLVEAGEKYVEMLTKAIVEHHKERRRIGWESIAEQAIMFCSGETVWQRSSEWLAKAFKAAGLESRLCTMRTKVAYETILLGWMLIIRSWDDKDPVKSFYDIARRKIRHVARLAPPSAVRTGANGRKTESRIPTLIELRSKGAISQKHAADHLRCSTRTIRNYIRNGALTKTPSGLVICDEKLTRKLRKKFGSALRMK